jgi:hypothetical protein
MTDLEELRIYSDSMILWVGRQPEGLDVIGR